MFFSVSFVVLTLLLVAGVAHAALTPPEYWKMMLPSTPMPGAVRDLLGPDVGVGAKVLANFVGGKLRTSLALGNYQARYRHGYRNGNVNEGGKAGSLPDEVIFFLEKDLRQGKTMRLDFTRGAPKAAFMPRVEADTIPFSYAELPAVLNRFSVLPGSPEAATMGKTLHECEQKDAEEESKHCATSLESMVDFATSALGTRDVRAASSEVGEGGVASKQEYVVGSSRSWEKTGAASSVVACHPQPYPYAVFYCHVTPATRAFVVPVVGKDGVKVDAVGVCHLDTSAWNPEHLAFQMTKAKPGTVPICHLFPLGGIVWTPRR